MSKREQWIIVDWAGNRCISEDTFDSFEDGWAAVYEYHRDLSEQEFDETMQEYSVELMQMDDADG